MRDWFLLCSGIVAGGVRSLVGLFLIFRLLACKKPGRKELVILLAGAGIPFTAVFLIGLENFYSIAGEALLLAVCAGRLGGADLRMSLFIGVFYEMGAAFWQFLLAAWAGVLLHSPAFLDCETGSGQLAVWLFQLLLLILAWYLWKRPELTGKEGFRLASLLALAGFLAVVTLSQQRALAISRDTLYMWTILSVVLMMSILVFNINRQYEAEKELAKLKSLQAELLEREYTTLNNAYTMNARLFHDFHNHMGVLRLLLSHKKMEEAMGYLEELEGPVKEMTDTLWTGDETIDYLINSKAVAARENGIRYEVQVEFPWHTNLQRADLCAILGNFLDNALEAAGKVPKKEQRFIGLTIRRIHQMLVIKVENSFWIPPVKEAGTLKTSKKEGLHGLGLKSAQTAAEKYEGMVQTSYTENIFRAVATLCFQSVSME